MRELPQELVSKRECVLPCVWAVVSAPPKALRVSHKTILAAEDVAIVRVFGATKCVLKKLTCLQGLLFLKNVSLFLPLS